MAATSDDVVTPDSGDTAARRAGSGDALSPAVDAAVAALSGTSSAVLLCHMRPDADTLGSGLGLGLALVAAGVEVQVAFPGDTPLSASLAALPGAELLVAPQDVTPADVAIAVDCASLARLAELADVAARSGRLVVIDHHASNPGFGDVNVVDVTASCTTEIVLRILDRWGRELTPDVATCLYAGLVTDTGSFRWCTADSHRTAARLLDAGVDGRLWSRRLLDTHHVGWLRLVSSALASATLDAEAFAGRGLVWAVVDASATAGLGWEEAESVIDLVRTAEEAEVAAVFKESRPGVWTVSLRSKSDVDVSAVAARFGGGGHLRAAGYAIDGAREEIVAALRAVAR